jgi:hypothetical protein
MVMNRYLLKYLTDDVRAMLAGFLNSGAVNCMVTATERSK